MRPGLARDLWWWAWFVAWGLLFATLAIPIVVGSFAVGRARFAFIAPLHRLWARVVMAVAFGEMFEVRGLEKLPAPGVPTVVVANHQSLIDTVIMHSFPRHLSHVMHRKWAFIPIMGFFMLAEGCLLVTVGDSDSGARLRRAAVERLRQGGWVLVYPEGQRSPDATVRRFRRGAFEIAREAGAPVLPVMIGGTHAFLPKGSWRSGSALRPHPVSLHVLDLVPADVVAASEPGELAARTRETIAAALRDDRLRRAGSLSE